MFKRNENIKTYKIDVDTDKVKEDEKIGRKGKLLPTHLRIPPRSGKMFQAYARTSFTKLTLLATEAPLWRFNPLPLLLKS